MVSINEQRQSHAPEIVKSSTAQVMPTRPVDSVHAGTVYYILWFKNLDPNKNISYFDNLGTTRIMQKIIFLKNLNKIYDIIN